MKHIKTFEKFNLKGFVKKILPRTPKRTIDTLAQAVAELTNQVSKFNEIDQNYIDIEKYPPPTEGLMVRIKKFNWTLIYRDNDAIQIGFDIYKDEIREHFSQIDSLENFIRDIVSKYTFSKMINWYAIEHKQVSDIVKELTLENFELFDSMKKYNL